MSGVDLTDLDVDNICRRLKGRLLVADGLSTVVVETQTLWPELAFRAPSIAALVDFLSSTPGRAVDPSRIGFLDIETTGLNAGAGTLVFIVGIATVRDDRICVSQFFLHEPSAEGALLSVVAEVLGGFEIIVTFNGRRFDVPLLVGRFDLYRMADPTPSRHVDLLQPARRIWARRLRQSNLSTLESRVLRVNRVHDCPGSEAPSRYFNFLHDRSIDGVVPVLDHNLQDLQSMVRLADLIGSMLVEPEASSDAASSDLLGLGSLFEDAGRPQAAVWCYESALVGGSTVDRAEALFRLARLADRELDLERVIRLLEAVSAFSVDRAVPASIELAKIHEHRRREPEIALMYARRALTLTRAHSNPANGRLVPEMSHRIRRLERKTANGSGSDSPPPS